MRNCSYVIGRSVFILLLSMGILGSNAGAFQKPDHVLSQPTVKAASSQSGQKVKVRNLRFSNSRAKLVESKSRAAGVVSSSVNKIDLETGNSIKELSRRQDNQGRLYTRYQQLAHDIPVWGEHIIMVSQRKAFKVRGNYIEGIKPELAQSQPALSASQAMALAKSEHLKLMPKLTNLTYRNEQVELAYYRDERDNLFLAYIVNYFAEQSGGGHPTRPFFVIDAKTKQVVTYWEGLMHAQVGTGPGGNTKTGQYEYGTDFGHLDVVVNGNTCTMENTNVRTIDLNHGTSGTIAYSYSPPHRNTHKAINGAFAPLNDAHYFGNVVFNMYNDWYSTPPLTFQLKMRVHYSTNYENAFWDGSSMTFGDGYSKFHPLVSLDVSSHEIAHGFTDQNSDLIYSGQSGGINEAFSDMSGEAAEFYMVGVNDFLVGETIYKIANKALRYMADPPLDGKSIGHVNNYYSGLDVHYSSGIYNKAFYLLATTSGWDTRKAFDVFVKANQDYWTPSTTFIEGAFGVLDAATDLGYNISDVKNAFSQVGINLTTPIITITQPDGSFDTATTSYKIEWTDYEPDYNAMISLYYDNNNSGQDGTLIVSNLSEDNDPDYYNWDTSGLSAGNYYVYAVIDNGVDAPVINYSSGPVTIAAPDAYEPDDTYLEASSITLNARQDNHSILPATDVDWVKFEIINVPANIQIETSGVSGDTRMWLYASNGTLQLDYDDSSGVGSFSKITHNITIPGTYYVKIDEDYNNSIINNYSVILTQASQDGYEPNNTILEATSITLNARQDHHSIVPKTDVDWLKFDIVNVPTAVELETSGIVGGDTRLWLYASDGVTQLAYDYSSGVGNYSRLSHSIATPGTYYVKIDENYNNDIIDDYSVSLTELIQDNYEPDNSYLEASSITINASQINHSIVPGSDVDWLKFEIPNVPNSIVLETNGISGGDTRMWLYASDGVTQLAFNDYGGVGNYSKINYNITTPGIYYVKVSGNYYYNTVENYNVTLTGTPPYTLDLIVDSISNSPAQPEIGDPVTFFVTVRNAGIVDDASGFAVGFWPHLNDAPIITTTPAQEMIVPSLAKGTNTVLTFNTTAPASGNFKAWAYVDRKNGTSEVTEDDETNNAGPSGGHDWKIVSVANLPFVDGFETGNLQSHWTTQSTNQGRIQVASTNTPQEGSYHVLMDAAIDSNYSLNEMVLHVDLLGKTNLQLEFYHKQFNDEADLMPISFIGSNNSDGVAISIDGNQWYRVQDLAYGSSSYQKYTIDLASIAATHGLTFNEHVLIKFQQYDNFALTTDGFGFDNIRITSASNGTPTVTATATMTSSPTISATTTATSTVTATPTITPTLTQSATYTITPTVTATPSISATLTHSATSTGTPSITVTLTISATSTVTPIVTATGTMTASPTPTATPTNSTTPTSTATPNATKTITQTSTATPTNSITFTATSTPTVMLSRTMTTTPTSSITATATGQPSTTTTSTPIATVAFKNKEVIAYPNPSRDVVNFIWKEPGVNRVEVNIFNMSGDPIATLRQNNPSQQVAWHPAGVGPGVYLCRVILYVDGKRQIQKIKKIAIIKH